MAACSLGGASHVKLCNFRSDFGKVKCSWISIPCKSKYARPGKLFSSRCTQIWQEPVFATRFDSLPRRATASSVSCAPSSANNDSQPGDLEVNQPARSQLITPKLESLIATICDTSSIAEVKLKMSGFELYVKRSCVQEDLLPDAPSIPPVLADTAIQALDANGSTTSLAIAKTEPSPGGIQRIVDTASDEGLVILQSPKVGFFRRSRTIKGKRVPPPCKEKQQVEEGQVLCYIEQLGGEIPIEADVSGEVTKILRKDGEPVGYGDALMTILPSFPGIKKLQ